MEQGDNAVYIMRIIIQGMKTLVECYMQWDTKQGMPQRLGTCLGNDDSQWCTKYRSCIWNLDSTVAGTKSIRTDHQTRVPFAKYGNKNVSLLYHLRYASRDTIAADTSQLLQHSENANQLRGRVEIFNMGNIRRCFDNTTCLSAFLNDSAGV